MNKGEESKDMLQLFSSRLSERNRRPRILILIVALWMIVALSSGTFLLYQYGFARADAPYSLVTFRGTVPTLIQQSKSLGAANTSQQISLSLGLRLQYADQLKGYVQDIYSPQSVNYHRYLTQRQFDGVFAPSPATYNAALHYLQQSGFAVTNTYNNRLLIAFKGSIGLAEQVFHVTINTYATPNGQTYYANTNDPVLPSTFASQVLSLDGLNNLVHFQHAAAPTGSVPGKSAATCIGHGSGYYTPDQIANAYNLNGAYNQGYHGEGQTVALFELASFQISDLTAYESCFGQSNANIKAITAGSDPIPAGKSMIQVETDAELILSAAPHLRQLRIYEAGTSLTDYNAQWAQILVDAPAVVSTSWYSCESDMLQNDPNELSQENTYFMTAAVQGQTILASSGDSGSSGCYFDGTKNTALSADDPASQPYVTAVGGTTLHLNASGSYGSESVWNDTPKTGQASGATGGGLSQVWSQPAWQSSSGTQNSHSNGKREVPDVSLNADYLTGYPIYCTAAAAGCNSGKPWIIEGGTEAAAPLWAAFIALTNEASEKTGRFAVGFANPLLYQDAGSSSYNRDFHDITSGNNNYAGLQSSNAYQSAHIYNLATGLGSYNAGNMLKDLVALNSTNSNQGVAPANTNWYFAEGSVGGGFTEYLTLENPDPVNTSYVAVTYLLQTSPPSTKTVNHTVNASSRVTVKVNDDLGISPTGNQVSVAAIVNVMTGAPIIAERPMYFDFNNIQSGTDVIGAPYPSTSYYFAEGNTTQSGSSKYWTFVTLLNPSSKLTDSVTLTYYTGSCTTNCPTETKTVGPMQRQTASPTDVGLHQQVAISVTSNNPVVAERPMYFSDNIPNAGGTTTGAASQIGATSTGTKWLFAEGNTGTNFQQYYELANFGSKTATATIDLEYPGGTSQLNTVTVPAYSFSTFDVNAHNGTQTANSAKITSDNPIVADRLMYFHYGSSNYSGGTDVIGTNAAASAYSFAEGDTAGNFTEFLTLQNPTAKTETVAITFFYNGMIFQQQQKVNAHSRFTLNVNSVPITPGAVSMTVQAISGSAKPVIVAERPMYFGYNNDQGGTDVIGYTNYLYQH